jgi:hypothetical protein
VDFATKPAGGSGGRADLVHGCAIAVSIFRVPEGIARFACGAIAHAILRCSIEAALLKVKAPMAGHGRGVDRTSMSPAANAGSCWWFHLRASRCNDAAGRAI